ncbi:MAG: hypothetical protein AAGG48_24445 [Planctomycetota bacterium]
MPFEYLIPSAIGFGFVAVAIAIVFNVHRIAMPVRLAAAGVFALIACFSVFGILATFEPLAGQIAWRIGYIATFAVAGLASLRLLTAKQSTIAE